MSQKVNNCSYGLCIKNNAMISNQTFFLSCIQEICLLNESVNFIWILKYVTVSKFMVNYKGKLRILFGTNEQYLFAALNFIISLCLSFLTNI